jgi:hypothetical protein
VAAIFGFFFLLVVLVGTWVINSEGLLMSLLQKVSKLVTQSTAAVFGKELSKIMALSQLLLL